MISSVYKVNEKKFLTEILFEYLAVYDFRGKYFPGLIINA